MNISTDAVKKYAYESLKEALNEAIDTIQEEADTLSYSDSNFDDSALLSAFERYQAIKMAIQKISELE